MAWHRPAHELQPVDRLAGGDENCTGAGVLAEQRSLRPAQHFDPADIEEGAANLTLATGVDAIDERADRRLEAEIEPRRESADRHAGLLAAFGDRQAGRLARQLAQVGDVEILDRLAALNAAASTIFFIKASQMVSTDFYRRLRTGDESDVTKPAYLVSYP